MAAPGQLLSLPPPRKSGTGELCYKADKNLGFKKKVSRY